MASNLLSRLLPPSAGSPSIYEALRRHDESADSDVEDQVGMSVDEENLGGGFQDYELDHTEGAGIEDSQMTSESTASLLRRDLEQATRQDGAESTNPRWIASSAALQDAMADAEDGDDEVPASLLVEGDGIPLPSRPNQGQTQSSTMPEVQPIPGNSTRETRDQWNATQGQQPLYRDDGPAETQIQSLPVGRVPFGIISRRDKAEWRWANVQNLDNFLKEVYEYFLMNGFRSILLSRLLNLLYVSSRLIACSSTLTISGHWHLSSDLPSSFPCALITAKFPRAKACLKYSFLNVPKSTSSSCFCSTIYADINV